MPTAIQFASTGLAFRLANKSSIALWIVDSAKTEDHQIEKLQFVFCSDEYLLQINKQFLKHDYTTDIITFGYLSEKLHAEDELPAICGEIYISIERVKANAKTYHVTFEDELKRVMIHGVLHLCGYADKTAAQKKTMRGKEDFYLQKFSK